MQTDPVGYEDQMNLYAYVHNDPMNYTDPRGEIAQAAIPIAIGVAAYRGYRAYKAYKAYKRMEQLRNLATAPPMMNESSDGSDGTPVEVDSTGKIHGGLPEIGDIDDENLDAWDKNLGESLQTRREENERFPNGNPNGDDKDKRNFEKKQQHRERIRDEQDLRERVRERIRERRQ